MRMRYLMEDNVRCELVGAHNTGVTTISITAGPAPYKVPPDPAAGAGDLYGNIGAFTLVDNTNAPSKIEIITYTGRNDLGGGNYTLTGCTRGTHGTTAQTWANGNILFQGPFFAQFLVPGIEASSDTNIISLTGWPVSSDRAITAGRGLITPPLTEVNASGAVSINWSNGSVQHIALTGNTTLTFTGGEAGGRYLLRVKTHASVTYTITWPTSIKWVSRVIPNHSTGASHEHLFTFYQDEGSSSFGSALINCGQP